MIKKVKLLVDGYFQIDKSQLVYLKSSYCGQPYMAALKPLLIETEADRILVDTGGGELPERFRKYINLERDSGLPEALKAEGLVPEDISIVINTHLHFDHCGHNKLFTKAKFYVQKTELEYAPNPHRFLKGGYIKDYFQDLKFEAVDGESWIIENEIKVIPTPGHTPGHQSVIIEGDDRRYIYCGDVAPMEENIRDRNIVGILHNPVQALESLDAVSEMEGTYIYSHDREQLELEYKKD
jgi:glyoxylase-like metal-dependent hydrolase (beta-lactamase superfamily II)